MGHLLAILIVIAVGATLGALGLGIFSMARGGDFDARNANRLMRLRVALQLVAVLLMGIAFLFSTK